MLGIDIGKKTIRVVRLTQRKSTFILHGALEIAFDLEQARDPVALGGVLQSALLEKGWENEPAVIAMPHRLCFVMRYSLDSLGVTAPTEGDVLSKSTVERLLDAARQSILTPSEELVFDLWYDVTRLTSRGGSESMRSVLVGAVRKSVVDFCVTLAEVSGVKLKSLELRSVASINGLLFHWEKDSQDSIAVVYQSDGRADLAMMDQYGLVSLQMLNLGGDGNGEALVEQLPRVFNTMKLDYSGYKAGRLYLAADSGVDSKLEALSGQLSERLGMEVSLCSVESLLDWPEDGPVEKALDYVPAIGVALNGLKVTPVWFDFLHPHGRLRKKTSRISLRPFIFVVIAILLFFSVFWGIAVQDKKTFIKDRDQEIADLVPRLEEGVAIRQKWNLFQSYLPASSDGSRAEYVKILYEISRLMPDTNEAYVEVLTINRDSDSLLGNYTVTITGRINKTEDLNDFIGRLNASRMIQVAQTTEPSKRNEDDLYQFSFSVSCTMRGGSLL